jgi:hypothetical protein
MITDLIPGVIAALRRRAAAWRTARRTGLNHHQPDLGPIITAALTREADDLMAIADALREPRPGCTCAVSWLCRACDPWYWIALEQTEGLGE